MKHEDHDQIDRHPWRVRQSDQAGTGQCLPHRRKIVQRLRRILTSLPEVALEGGIEDPCIDVEIEACPDAHENHRPDPLEQGHQRKQPERNQGQHQQRRHVAAPQSAVVDLKHVDGGRQHQQIDEEAESADSQEGPAKGQQSLFKFGALLGVLSHPHASLKTTLVPRLGQPSAARPPGTSRDQPDATASSSEEVVSGKRLAGACQVSEWLHGRQPMAASLLAARMMPDHGQPECAVVHASRDFLKCTNDGKSRE